MFTLLAKLASFLNYFRLAYHFCSGSEVCNGCQVRYVAGIIDICSPICHGLGYSKNYGIMITQS